MDFKRNGNHGGTLRGMARVLGTSDSRLRAMEKSGLLPTKFDEYELSEKSDYFETAFLILAGRRDGMPPQAIRRALLAIRKAASLAELEAKQGEAVDAVSEMAASGELGKTSLTRAEWYRRHNSDREEK